MGIAQNLPWKRRSRTHASPLGYKGEQAAARFLRRAGHRIIARNVRLASGEVDLVALAPDRRTIVIVEVKARRALASTRIPPEASVTSRKEAKLLSLTEQLVARNGWTDRPIRIDVVAVTWEEGRRRPRIEHFIDAVRVRPSRAGRRASRGTRSRA